MNSNQKTSGERLAVVSSSTIAIDVVICTYNRSTHLNETLEALAQQDVAEGVRWKVLVVDNASTDATAAVVETHRTNGALPELRRVFERKPGLTPARQSGVRETTAPWVVFVDDDNLLEPGWLTAVSRAIRSHPDAGGIGGRVVLDWDSPPPGFLKEFGFCFAEQNAGNVDCMVDSLVGAGMCVRRSALVASDWANRPLLADRVGSQLVSGGDAEIAQRIRAAGYSLWFTPHAVMRHRIPRSRTTRRYLFRINVGLGASEAIMSALTWVGDWPSWRYEVTVRRRRWYYKAARGLAFSLLNRHGVTSAIAWACFALGFGRGVRTCESLATSEQVALLGAAAVR